LAFLLFSMSDKPGAVRRAGLFFFFPFMTCPRARWLKKTFLSALCARLYRARFFTERYPLFASMARRLSFFLLFPFCSKGEDMRFFFTPSFFLFILRRRSMTRVLVFFCFFTPSIFFAAPPFVLSRKPPSPLLLSLSAPVR